MFPRNEEFNSRIYHLFFNDTNVLKGLRKKLDPRCLILLFDKYLHDLILSEYELCTSSDSE